jgi:hypothetical protein
MELEGSAAHSSHLCGDFGADLLALCLERIPSYQPAIDPNKEKLEQLAAASLRAPLCRMWQVETVRAKLDI